MGTSAVAESVRRYSPYFDERRPIRLAGGPHPGTPPPCAAFARASEHPGTYNGAVLRLRFRGPALCRFVLQAVR